MSFNFKDFEIILKDNIIDSKFRFENKSFLKEKLIYSMSDLLSSKFDIVLCVGIELEFFIKTNSQDSLFKDFSILGDRYKSKWIQEECENQYEFIFPYSENLFEVISNIKRFKSDIMMLVENIYVESIPLNPFHPKPFCNKNGSGMHVNISINKKSNKKNILSEDRALKNIINGILNILNRGLLFIIGDHDDEFLRFKNNLVYKTSPTFVNWGVENRTAAIRVPKSNLDNKRIEFRVPSSNCDIQNVIIFLLIGIFYSFGDKNFEEYKQIYCNSHDLDVQCNEILCQNLSQCISNYQLPNITYEIFSPFFV